MTTTNNLYNLIVLTVYDRERHEFRHNNLSKDEVERIRNKYAEDKALGIYDAVAIIEEEAK